MTNYTFDPNPVPSRRAAAHEYLRDMLQQLAKLARASGEMQIAILLEAVLAADSVVPRPH